VCRAKGGPFSLERSVSRDFVSTWETAPTLSTGDASGGWVVLVTLGGGLGGVFGLLMAMGIYSDVSERKSVLASVAPVLVSVGGGRES
jgi:hypothetical protein